MIYVVRETYNPTAAGTIRMNGLLKELSKRSAVTVLFLLPDAQQSKVKNPIPNVSYEYLWDTPRYENCKISYYGEIGMLLKRLRTIHRGEPVIVLGCRLLLWVFVVFGSKRTYHEITEYPELWSERWRPTGHLLHKIYLWACRRAEGVFVISEALKEYFIRNGVKNRRIQIVNMTVDAERFEKITKTDKRDRYIAYCGTVTNYKDGVDVLLKAFAKVDIPDLKLYVIGPFDKPTDEIQDRDFVARAGIADRVVFTGAVDADRMPQLLTDAEALILARPDNIQAHYGFPTKVGEYLLTGNPTVVTAVGDLPRFLTNGVNAYIAKAGDIDDIASKIKEAVCSTDAKTVGQRGKQTALENFNNQTESRKVADCIELNKISA